MQISRIYGQNIPVQSLFNLQRIAPSPQTSRYIPGSTLIDSQRLETLLESHLVLTSSSGRKIGKINLRKFVTNLYSLLRGNQRGPKRLDISGSGVRYLIGPNAALKLAEKHNIKTDNLEAFNNFSDLDILLDMSDYNEDELGNIPFFVASAIWMSLNYEHVKYKKYETLCKELFLNRFTKNYANDKYTVLTIGDPKMLKVDISGVISSDRTHLSSYDSYKIDLRPYLDGHGDLFWVTDLHDPDLPIKHILQKKMWVDDIEKLNFMGFPRIALYLVKGLQMVDQNDRPIDVAESMKILSRTFLVFHRASRKSIPETFKKIKVNHIGNDLVMYQKLLTVCFPFLINYLTRDEALDLIPEHLMLECPEGMFLSFMQRYFQSPGTLGFTDLKCLVFLLGIKPAMTPTPNDWHAFLSKGRCFGNGLWQSLFPKGMGFSSEMLVLYLDQKIPLNIDTAEAFAILESSASEEEMKIVHNTCFAWELVNNLFEATLRFCNHPTEISEHLQVMMWDKIYTSEDLAFLMFFENLYAVAPKEIKIKWIDKIVDNQLWKRNECLSCISLIRLDDSFFQLFISKLQDILPWDVFVEFAQKLGIGISQDVFLNQRMRMLIGENNAEEIRKLLDKYSIFILDQENKRGVLKVYAAVFGKNDLKSCLALLKILVDDQGKSGQKDEIISQQMLELLNISKKGQSLSELISLYLEPDFQKYFELNGILSTVMDSTFEPFSKLTNDLKDKWLICICESSLEDQKKLNLFKKGLKGKTELGAKLAAALKKMAENFKPDVEQLSRLYTVLQPYNIKVKPILNLEALFDDESCLKDNVIQLWALMEQACEIETDVRRAVIEKLILANDVKKPSYVNKLIKNYSSLWQQKQHLSQFLARLPKDTSLREKILKLSSEWESSLQPEIKQMVLSKKTNFFEVYKIDFELQGDRELIRSYLTEEDNPDVAVALIHRWQTMSKEDLALVLGKLSGKKYLNEIGERVIDGIARITSLQGSKEVCAKLSVELGSLIQGWAKQAPEVLLFSLHHLDALSLQVEKTSCYTFLNQWFSAIQNYADKGPPKTLSKTMLNKVVNLSSKILRENPLITTEKDMQNWQSLFTWLSTTNDKEELQQILLLIQSLIFNRDIHIKRLQEANDYTKTAQAQGVKVNTLYMTREQAVRYKAEHNSSQVVFSSIDEKQELQTMQNCIPVLLARVSKSIELFEMVSRKYDFVLGAIKELKDILSKANSSYNTLQSLIKEGKTPIPDILRKGVELMDVYESKLDFFDALGHSICNITHSKIKGKKERYLISICKRYLSGDSIDLENIVCKKTDLYRLETLNAKINVLYTKEETHRPLMVDGIYRHIRYAKTCVINLETHIKGDPIDKAMLDQKTIEKYIHQVEQELAHFKNPRLDNFIRDAKSKLTILLGDLKITEYPRFGDIQKNYLGKIKTDIGLLLQSSPMSTDERSTMEHCLKRVEFLQEIFSQKGRSRIENEFKIIEILTPMLENMIETLIRNKEIYARDPAVKKTLIEKLNSSGLIFFFE